MTTTYQIVSVNQLTPGQYQPRKAFDKQGLEELAHSIASQGLIEPLVVREIASNRYEIIAGERRWRASLLAGLTNIPCLIGHYSDEQAATLALIENIQREDLNILEEAQGYQRLIQEFHFTQEDVAKMVGKSRSHIANILRLLTLCPLVQEYLWQKTLTLGHARVLVGLDVYLQAHLAQKAIAQDWSVRKLEEEVRLQKQTSPPPPNSLEENPDMLHLQAHLAEQMGAPVQISLENNQSGWLKIKFFDNETLSGLLERMGLRYD